MELSAKCKEAKWVLLIAVLFIIGTVGKDIYVCRQCKINDTKITLLKEENERLSLNKSIKNIKWSSDNEDIVSVSKTGKIKGLQKGSAVITAKYLWKTMKCKVVVEEPEITEKEITILPGETQKVELSGTTQKVYWDSSNPNIKVGDDGTISADKPVEGTVTASVHNKEYQCKVHVPEPELTSEYTIKKGEKEEVVLKNVPEEEKVKWTIKNKEIAEAEKSESPAIPVKGINVGKTEITAEYNQKVYRTTVLVTGDQALTIKGNDTVDLGKTEELQIENFIKGYKATWENAEGKDEKAVFKGEKRGSTVIKAVVDTGAEKVTLQKEISVTEKKLNTDKWEGKPGDSFVLQMQDGENPVFTYDANILEFDGTKSSFKAVAPGQTTIEVEDESTKLTCAVTVNGSSIIDHVKNIAKKITDNRFTYGNDGKSSFEKSLNSNKKVNCALGISWALQEAGYLNSNEAIYYSNGLKGSGADTMKSNGNVSITYPNKGVYECDLQPGDICGFMIGKSRVPHTAVYAGENSDGKALWYTFGKDATTGGVYQDIDECGPVTQGYYKTVEMIMRCN